jgi:hypothetical protein
MTKGTFPVLDKYELAWAAGFFDGEGNIRAKSNKQWSRVYYHPVMSINQIDPQVLQRFRRAVGGLGRVSGPWDRARYAPNRQPQWSYEASSFEQVQAVTALLWNWLSPVKRDQARAVFMKLKEFRPEPRVRRVGCSVEGCGRPHSARGWCQAHYLRLWWSRRGDVTVTDETSGITTTVPGTF